MVMLVERLLPGQHHPLGQRKQGCAGEGMNDLCSCKLKQGTEMPRARRRIFPGHSRAMCSTSAVLSRALRAVGLSI